MILLILACVLLAAAGALWWWCRREVEEPSPAPKSIVLLLQVPRPLNAEILAYHAQQVTGEPVGLGASAAGGSVIGESAPFFLPLGGTMFVVHSVPAPYFDDFMLLAAGQPNLRLRRAIEEHRAWLSVDVLGSDSGTLENHRTMARLAARFLGPECVLLYHPPTGRFGYNTDETIALLESKDPFEAVFAPIPHSPVITVDTPSNLAEATAEAKARFPEFVEAFRQRRGNLFSVKAPVSREDRTEHIWIDLVAIEGDELRGVLGNDPLDLPGLRMGSAIVVPVSDVEDWVYVRDGKMAGGFSTKILLSGL